MLITADLESFQKERWRRDHPSCRRRRSHSNGSRRYLSDQGLLEEANADGAIEIMEQTPLIHALVTDIDMSGSMKGLELARHAAETRPDWLNSRDFR